MRVRRLVRSGPTGARTYCSLAGIALVSCASLVLSACTSTTPIAGTWSGPTVVANGSALVDVSCPSSSTCTAIDARGNSVTLSGGQWGPAIPIPGGGSPGNGPVAISCGGTGSCAAGLGNGILTNFDGRTWSADGLMELETPTSISCPDSQFCVAAGDSGTAMIRNGSWSAPDLVDSGGSLTSVSCTSRTFCVAVSGDTPGTAYTFDGEGWFPMAAPNPSTPQGGSEPDTLSAVSCATSTYCVALDDFGEFFTWDGKSWSNATVFDNIQDGDDAVSCSRSELCMIVDDSGVAVPLDKGTLGPPRQLDSDTAGLNGVSCIASATGTSSTTATTSASAPATRCVAVGGGGRAFTFSTKGSS